ncbi:MAG: cytochrome c [Vicinamibacterales bacterium]
MTATVPVALAVWVVGVSALAACSRAPEPSAEAGRDLYAQNGCASCHGPNGHGDGPVGRTLETRPRDFRDASAFKQGTDITSIAETIATGVTGVPRGNGVAAHERHHSQVMPQFDHLSEWERRSLALHVISLRNTTATERNQP